MRQRQEKIKEPLRVAVTGASGLVGSELVPFLEGDGHCVTRLVRGPAGEGRISWNPAEGVLDTGALRGMDAIVHLAGENIAAARWSDTQKQRIRDSRVKGTTALCEVLARMDAPPRVLVSASAIGFYSDRGDTVLTEEDPEGEGFLARVVKDWEGATAPARAAGIRVVNLRFGMILSSTGGALGKMLRPFKCGVGGRTGNGRQYWSWISLNDAVRAVYHSLTTDSLVGPVNAVAPDPVTNAEFARTLGRVLSRPTFLPLPAFAARFLLGEMADALLLASTRVHPKRLLETGFQFRQPTLESALRHLLGEELSPIG